MADQPIRDWFHDQSDNIIATVFIAVLVALGVGFTKRSTGAAIFLAAFCGAVVSVIATPYLSTYEWYSWKFAFSVQAPLCGACGWVAFRLLAAFADRLDARRSHLADRIIDKGESLIPGKETADGSKSP